MDSSVSFFVEGVAVPQGSKTPITRNGRTVLIEAAKGFKPWRDAVVLAARHTINREFVMFDEPVRVGMIFVFPKPPSTKFGLFPAGKPDLDKCARLVNDALTISGLIKDDARVVALDCVKRWAVVGEPTGVWVNIQKVTV